MKSSSAGTRCSSATSEFPRVRIHLLALLLLASLAAISESQKNRNRQGRIKLQKCSEGYGKCIEVPKDVIFDLFETISNLKNAFNGPLNAGRHRKAARAMPVTERRNCKKECSNERWNRRRCMRKCKKDKQKQRTKK